MRNVITTTSNSATVDKEFVLVGTGEVVLDVLLVVVPLLINVVFATFIVPAFVIEEVAVEIVLVSLVVVLGSTDVDGGMLLEVVARIPLLIIDVHVGDVEDTKRDVILLVAATVVEREKDDVVLVVSLLLLGPMSVPRLIALLLLAPVLMSVVLLCSVENTVVVVAMPLVVAMLVCMLM